MFNVGGPEIVVIFLVALVVLGPDQLPKAMRTFGNVMSQVRKVSGGFQAELRSAMESAADGMGPSKPSTSSGTATAAESRCPSRAAADPGPEAPAPTAPPAADEATDDDPAGPALVDRAAG